MEDVIGTQAIEPWLADIATELKKIRELMEEGLPVYVTNDPLEVA